MKLKVLDLFSGIGGFSVGLERTGNFETVAFCEIDKYCKLLLQKHWKGVKIYDDVKKITKEGLKADGIESPDVITGGVPCQPFSVAGKQKGTSDNRHLWPEMFRIIKAFKSRFVIVENVRGLINIQDGVVFEAVCTDLESEGYEVQPFIIPAAGVGAPHRRERVWILAIREESMADADTGRSNGSIKEIQTGRDTSITSSEDVADTITGNAQTGRERQRKIRKGHQEEGVSNHVTSRSKTSRTEDVVNSEHNGSPTSTIEGSSAASSNDNEKGQNETSESEGTSGSRNDEDVADTKSFSSDVGGRGEHQEERNGQRKIRGEDSTDASNTNCTGSQRLGSEHELRNSEKEKQTRRIGWWDTEPDVGRVAHGVSGRVHRLKGLGNAIVPQIAEEIGRAIIKAERIK